MSEIDLDFGRTERLGFPEIIYGAHKTIDQLEAILGQYRDRKMNSLITKLQPEKAQPLLGVFSEGIYDPQAQTYIILYEPPTPSLGIVGVISGGTSDASIVREAANTLAFLGYEPLCYNDIGVAGLHRLQAKLPELETCDVLIVVAGFEGALPSVVGGLLGQPIIAVPTSVGYGVAEGGRTALNAMLSSCANGIMVMNIDNGCGAALASARIMRRVHA
ncbi:MAG: NCAIR mutase (PurE)-related protein [Candidatus Omnitrophota bacterium]|jgi:NCAIR mutase (PurE)-related protein